MVESHCLLLFLSEVLKTISNYSMLIWLMLIKSWMLHPILCDVEASDSSFFLSFPFIRTPTYVHVHTQSRRRGMDGTCRFCFYLFMCSGMTFQCRQTLCCESQPLACEQWVQFWLWQQGPQQLLWKRSCVRATLTSDFWLFFFAFL